LCGYAECVKYSLLFSRAYFGYLDQNLHLLHARDPAFLNALILESCSYKKNVVEQDEFDTNQSRFLLNLGHTFGHALESYYSYSNSLLHGEAISVGMVLAFKVANILNLCPMGDTSIVVQHFLNAGLHTSLKGLTANMDDIITIMLKDKKNSTSEEITLVLPTQIGHCIVQKNVPAAIIKQALKEILLCM